MHTQNGISLLKESELLAWHPIFILSESYLKHICNWKFFLLLTKKWFSAVLKYVT